MLIAAATIPYIRRIDTDKSEDEHRGHHQGLQRSTGLLSSAECLLLSLFASCHVGTGHRCKVEPCVTHICCVLQRASLSLFGAQYCPAVVQLCVHLSWLQSLQAPLACTDGSKHVATAASGAVLLFQQEHKAN